MNNCIFIGRLANTPELRDAGDTKVANFSIAVNRKYKSNGELRDEVSFLDMVAWDKGAETIAKYFDKGDSIILYCSAKQEVWEDKDTSKKRSKVVFRVERFEFPPANSKNKSNGSADNEDSGIPVGAGVGSAAGGEAGGQVGEDEIPF